MNVAVAKIMARLVELGFSVLQPLSGNNQYDLVTESCGKFTRIQVKIGGIKEGAIFATLYNEDHKGEVDQFGIYCPGTGGTYMIDATEVKGSIKMRLEPPKNKSHSKWAENYRI